MRTESIQFRATPAATKIPLVRLLREFGRIRPTQPRQYRLAEAKVIADVLLDDALIVAFTFPTGATWLAERAARGLLEQTCERPDFHVDEIIAIHHAVIDAVNYVHASAPTPRDTSLVDLDEAFRAIEDPDDDGLDPR